MFTAPHLLRDACQCVATYLPTNARLALLDERPQALLGVVRREHDRVQVGLVDEVAADVAVQRPVRRLLGVVQRDRALRRHQLGHLERPRHQLRRRVDVLDEAALERLVGVDHAAGQDQLLGVADVGRAGEPLGAAPAGDDPEVDLGLAEVGVLGREPDVAGQRHLAAAAERVAVDGGDRRLAHRLEHVGDLLAELGVGARLERRLAVHLLDVGAGDERAVAGAGQHDHAAARRRRRGP